MNASEVLTSEEQVLDDLRRDGLPALAEHFNRYRSRLKKSVNARIDRRLASRMDDSDVVQEAFVEAAGRLDEYLSNPRMPLFVWLRFIAQQGVRKRHRQHFDVQKRNPEREAGNGDASSNLIDELAMSMVSPHSLVARAEFADKVRELVSEMSDGDREILTMVHLEELSLAEASAALELPEETVRKRHYRAIGRLRQIVKAIGEDAT